LRGGGFCRFFIKNTRFYGGETRAHGVPIHERIKKFKTRIYIIIPIFPPPHTIGLTQVGVEGVALTGIPSRL